jgi:hypothetical protein
MPCLQELAQPQADFGERLMAEVARRAAAAAQLPA